ncbi:MAG TPA: enoyl-CoA hydratase-related protein [Polyangiales bacterium]|nr:enoyl-CoA hydratase-related protein [Polyangiales bacterium]
MSEQAPLEAANLRNVARPAREWPGVATLWDPGDGAAVFELTREDALITPEVIAALAACEPVIADGFEGLILTSNHPRLFAFGAAGPFRHTIQTGDAAPSLAFLLEGQSTLQQLRGAPFPVVAAVHGLAFSGACEIALFANGLVVEETAPIALKEIWVGLIPGWGGCCQLMLRQQAAGHDALASARIALTLCARGHIAQGEVEGRQTHLLRSHDRTVQSRAELIPSAQALVHSLAGTQPERDAVLQMPAAAEMSELKNHVAQLDEQLGFALVEAAGMQALLGVLTASSGASILESEYMAREAHAFLPLLKPSLGPRFAHLARTGQRPPRDA